MSTLARALVDNGGPELSAVLDRLAAGALTVEACDRELERLRFKVEHLACCRLCQRRVERDLIPGVSEMRARIDRWLDVRHELAQAAA